MITLCRGGGRRGGRGGRWKGRSSDLMKMGRMGVTVKFRKRSKSLPAESASDQLSNG
jgi:hypothetical protein